LGRGNDSLQKLKNPRLLQVAGFSVWNLASADHRHILNVGMAHEKRFDLYRVDVSSTGDDCILFPIYQSVETFAVRRCR